MINNYNIWNCINYSMLKLSDAELKQYWVTYANNRPNHKLFEFMGWSGGTIHQFIDEILKLKRTILG